MTALNPAVSTAVLDVRTPKQTPAQSPARNAIKFTPERGRVTIKISPEGGEHFRLDVEDTGIGIEPQNMARLFVEFQQLRRREPAKIVRGHGASASR